MRSRASSGGWPKTRISPCVGRSRPKISLTSVVLPPPLGPTMHTASRSQIDRFTSSNTGAPVGEADVAKFDDGRAGHGAASACSDLFSHVVEVGHNVVGQVVHRHHRAADRLRDRLGRLRIETRLEENDLHVVGAGLLDQLDELPRRGRLALDLDRLLPQAVGVGEVAEGRMEDVKRLPAIGREAGIQAAIEGVEFGIESGLIS